MPHQHRLCLLGGPSRGRRRSAARGVKRPAEPSTDETKPDMRGECRDRGGVAAVTPAGAAAPGANASAGTLLRGMSARPGSHGKRCAIPNIDDAFICQRQPKVISWRQDARGDMVPPQGARFLSAQADQQAQCHVPARARILRGSQHCLRLSSATLIDGRPARPFGVLTSAATLRLTRSLPERARSRGCRQRSDLRAPRAVSSLRTLRTGSVKT